MRWRCATVAGAVARPSGRAPSRVDARWSFRAESSAAKLIRRPNPKGVFFCYALPRPSAGVEGNASTDADAWSAEKGFTQWYLYDLASERVEEEPSVIIGIIRSEPQTPRQHIIEEETLSEIRKKIEKHIKNTCLRRVQAPQGVKPTLKAWMELS